MHWHLQTPTVAFVSQLLSLAWQFQQIGLYNIYPVLLLLVLPPSMHRQLLMRFFQVSTEIAYRRFAEVIQAF